MAEEGAKALLFAAVAILVFIFIARTSNVLKAAPEWTNALTASQQAINSLDPDKPELTRTINAQLKNYHIKGLNKENCPVNEKAPYCVCACSDAECSNAKNDEKKYCRNVKYEADGYVIKPDSDKLVTYKIGFDDNKKLAVLGVS
ncbi:MAG: hypothetical protein AABW92_00070 [Nanoarchaeota archaeon]